MQQHFLVRNRVQADALAPLWDLDIRQSAIMGGAILGAVLAALILFS